MSVPAAPAGLLKLDQLEESNADGDLGACFLFGAGEGQGVDCHGAIFQNSKHPSEVDRQSSRPLLEAAADRW